MSDPSDTASQSQSGPIVVYGASGYTGKLIARELARRGAELTLAGRDRRKLESVAAGLDAEPAIAAVPLDDRRGLRDLLDGAGAVIACAGPFTLHGEPVLEAAVQAGTHYLDTTGEQPFIRRAFDSFGARAEEAGAAVVSGMGFDYAPGDLIAALAAEGLGPLDEVTLAYSVRSFGPTRGTALSTLQMLGAGDVEWTDGAYREADPNADRGQFDFPSPIGRRRVGRYPAGEQIMVPKHIETRTVRTLIDLRALLGVNLGPLSAPTMTAAGYAMRSALRAPITGLVERMPEGPGEDARKAARFTVVCEARGNGGGRRAVVRGGDVYGITAVCTVESALRMAAPGYERAGALAPAQAFDPADFLASLAEHGVAYEVGELR